MLGGGGARGAYTSGALSVLLRELKHQVTVIVGTSAGALTAEYLAATGIVLLRRRPSFEPSFGGSSQAGSLTLTPAAGERDLAGLVT